MENKTTVVTDNSEMIETSKAEAIDVVVFDKDAMRRDLSNGLKEFGVGCCEAGKNSLAPLASTMVKHLFNWFISSLLQ